MPTSPQRLRPAFQLTRLSLVMGAIADVWFVILYTKGDARYNHVPSYEMPLAIGLLVTVVLAIGLFAFAGTLNDLLDSRHDSAFSPDRPIPSGRIRASQAVVIAVGSLLVALAAAIPFGTLALVFAILAATGILFYDATGKHIPAVGVLLAGLIHVAHMMIPNYDLAFTPPVWLVFTHVAGMAVLIHVVENKRPRFGRWGVVATILGWIAWSAVILGLGLARGPEAGFAPTDFDLASGLWPAAAAVAFAVVIWRKLARVGGQVGAEKVRRYGAAWHAFYGAAWFAGLGWWRESVLMAVIAVGGLIVMTLLREVSVDDPGLVGYRS